MISDNSKDTGRTFGLIGLLTCKCPRCRKGAMFSFQNPWNLKHTMDMHEACPVCNQSFNLEPGFYYGSSYASYALTVALSAATFVLFWIIVGFPFAGNFIIYWLISNAILLFGLQPWLMRVSRTIWLAFFVRYDPGWAVNPPVTPERVNKEQENNW